ncbi:hypothetical protein J4225_03175 [Candidatus Pacearchaeota archaeon]|nr:hypothetical protein [Candidatus Pacearchaeota archaeon]
MDVNVIKSSKDEVEIELGNLTIAELLRVYLNKDSDVNFAVWKRDHPTQKPVLKIKTKGKSIKKAVEDAIKAIEKDLNKLEADAKNAK